MSIGVAAAFLLGCSGKKDDFLAPPAALGPVSDQRAGTAPPPPPAAGSAAAPAAPGPFSLKPGEQLVNHRIVKGDTLSGLAGRYKTRVSRIKSANGLTSDLIIEGRTLRIPTSLSSPPPAAASASPPPISPAPAERGFRPLTPPSTTPPAITPPATTPPAITPPATTPPAITPPATTPPAITPPGTTPPSTPSTPSTPNSNLNFGTPPPSGSPRINDGN